MKTEDLLAHENFVRCIARRLVSDEDRTSDITQQAWLAALERPPSSNGLLRSWLSKVTRNLAIKRIRGDARRIERERTAAVPEVIPSTDEIVALEEVRREVVDAILELDDLHRSVVFLRFYHDLPWTEVAKSVGAPVETARSRLKRGLAKLREKLDKKFGDRDSWCLALAPLAGLKVAAQVATAGVAASAVSTVSGGVIMATKVKVAIAAVVVLGSSLVVWQNLPTANIRESVSRIGDHEDVGNIAQQSVQEDDSPAPKRVPIEAEKSSGNSLTGKERDTVHVKGRFIDRYGVPIEGVRVMSYRSSSALTASDSDGLFEAVAPINLHPSTGAEVHLYADKENYAQAKLGAKATHGDTIHLGDIVLYVPEARGLVSGVVVDQRGIPVSDAWVGWTNLDIDEDSVSSLRLSGPSSFRGDFRDGDPMDRRGLFEEPNTRLDGTFFLQGVQVGRGRVWATSDETLCTFSDVVEVRASEETTGIKLTLETPPADRLVRGIVLDPKGNPVPEARIKVICWSGKTSCSMSLDTCDSEGRFSYILGKKTRHTFEALVESKPNDIARVDDITEGTQDLVIQFTVRNGLCLSVHSIGGEAVDVFNVATKEEDRFANWSESTYRKQDLDKDGLAEVSVPRDKFSVKVESAGYQPTLIGPFEPAALPERVEVILIPIPGVTGCVSTDGQPVPGAKISLCKAVEPGTVQTVNDFVCRSYQRRTITEESDHEGFFTLWLRESGIFYLRAEADGFAVSEVGPIRIDHKVGKRNLEIVLTNGGAIEGYVEPPPNLSRAGIIVVISRGDGFSWSTRTDENGFYRFENLTPGPWQVGFREKEINLGGGHTANSWRVESTPTIPWSCVVEEGRTTRYDLDMIAEKMCVSGTLTLYGEEATGWKASLWSNRGGGGSISESTLNDQGRFRMKIPIAGTYLLQIIGGVSDESQLVIRDFIHVEEGTNSWSCTLSFGRVEVNGLPLLSDGTKLYHWRDGPGDLQTHLKITPDQDGSAVLSVAPAGKGVIRRLGRDQTRKVSIDEVLAEVYVPAGGTATVELK